MTALPRNDDYAYEVRRVRLADIAGTSYQRLFRLAKAKKILAHWRPERANRLFLNHRTDARFYTIDGQHRLWVMRQLGIASWDCVVYEGLNYQQEAALCYELNDFDTASPFTGYDRYWTGLQASYAEEVALTEACDQYGFEVARRTNRVRQIAAIDALRHCYRMDVLTAVLNLIDQRWGDDGVVAEAVRSPILDGLGQFLYRYRDDGLDMDRLLDLMTTYSPAALIRDARDAQFMGQLGGPNSVRSKIGPVLRKRYNKGLTHPLGPWHREDPE